MRVLLCFKIQKIIYDFPCNIEDYVEYKLLKFFYALGLAGLQSLEKI